MAAFSEYEHFDGLGLAALVRRGEVSPAEILEAALERIERLNPRLNAVVTRMEEAARRALSRLPDGPFRGVPFLIKDLLSVCAGVPLTFGSRALRNFVPDHDGELVRRWRRAGLVIVGKTNTPELGLVAYTEPELFGPTRNPWDPGRTPGGSSGGAAAAVAAGIVPLAGAGDGGGSIRIPAAYCGLFGLKPSRGRTPSGPDFGEIWQGAVVEHVVSRTVRDSAAALDAVCGPERGAPYIVAPPERPYLEEVRRDPGRLRVAFSIRSPVGLSVHPEHAKAVLEAAVFLARAGFEVEEREPPLDGIELARSYLTLLYAEVAADLREIERLLGRRLSRADVERPTWILGKIGWITPAPELSAAKRLWGRAGRVMGEFHETWDLYLSPTTAHPPARIGELRPGTLEMLALRAVDRLGLVSGIHRLGLLEKIAFRNLERTPFTQLANFTGQPAMSVPVAWSRQGLPIGVQFTAPIGREDLLFRLAGLLETERPWFERRPPPAALSP
ncbi:MAG: amidase family protein [Desulfobacterales bacterium]